jgi:hypothetical protein
MDTHSFETAQEAQVYIRDQVDTPVDRKEVLNDKLDLRAYAHGLPSGGFTNIYDISYRPDVASAICVSDELRSVYSHAQENPRNVATVSGGFFFLADQCEKLPRQLALNLAIADGRVRSLPVVDREAVITTNGRLSTSKILAWGELSINGVIRSWAGSKTDHEADCTVYGNGNSVIAHQRHESTGSVRVHETSSRYTPVTEDKDLVDIGFLAQPDGSFMSAGLKGGGGLDIFGYDVVLRGNRAVLPAGKALNMKVRNVGSLVIDRSLQGAFSAGPLLSESNFEQHAINSDSSLGSVGPFLERPLARTALYETDDGVVHVRLFDGRPGSETFPGVTPSEAVAMIREDNFVTWGCFLDPGQTAKLNVRHDEGVTSYGNRHYLKWATKPGERFDWVPELGRPVATMIAIQ